MQAMVGDRLHIHSRSVGMEDRQGEIIEVRGADGAPRTWSSSRTATRA